MSAIFDSSVKGDARRGGGGAFGEIDVAVLKRNSVFSDSDDEREKEEHVSTVNEDDMIFIFRLLDRFNHSLLRLSELSVLGEAIIGHPPSETTMKKQVHVVRTKLVAENIMTACVSFCNDMGYSKATEKDFRMALVQRFLVESIKPLLKRQLNIVFPDSDVIKMKDACHERLYAKIGSIFGRKSKAKTFSRARSNMALRLDILLEIQEIMLTEEIILMVEETNAKYYTLNLEEFLGFSRLTLSACSEEQVGDFAHELMRRICALQSRLTNVQRKYMRKERMHELEKANAQLQEDFAAVRAAAGKSHGIFAERLDLERRLRPGVHDWRFVEGEWKEIVIRSSEKYEEVK
jgi:hypothetical protein|eukprot:Stramenopile-MAST_4_protein_3292